jgi:hypothetical protein
MTDRSVSGFMDSRAVDLRTGGRYSLANRYDLQGNRREFACRTSRISPYQMLVEAPVLGPTGDRIITYFGELGKLDGWITDVSETGFLVEIAATRKIRERLASKLIWLDKKQKDVVVDARAMRRLIPENPHTSLIFADGSTLSCFVIDVSPSGVAVSADVEAEIGTRLAVGRAVGNVVRRFNEGFAVRFDQIVEPTFLEQVIRPPTDFETYHTGQGCFATPKSAVPGPEKSFKAVEATGPATLSAEKNVWVIG